MDNFIEFHLRDVSGNKLKKQTGRKVGDWLVITLICKKYEIYKLHNGRPLLDNVLFVDFNDALQTAEWLDNQYSEYFLIWIDYPLADVFGLARWSVRNGIKIYELLQSMKNKEI